MKRQDFWKYISLIDTTALQSEDEEGAIVRIIDELALLPVAEICSFYDHLAEALYLLDTRQHLQASQSQSDDSFLYARCYVLGMGQEFYEQVLSDPKCMPAGIKWFEFILSVPGEAWSVATGEDPSDWNYFPNRSFESGSNFAAWGEEPGVVSDIRLYDTRELVEEMLLADRTEKSSLGAKYSELSQIFAANVQKLRVKTNSSCIRIFLQLTPMVKHGQHRHVLGDKGSETITFNSGVRPRTYLGMNESERVAFFVDLMSTAIEWLGMADGDVAKKLLQAKELSTAAAASVY